MSVNIGLIFLHILGSKTFFYLRSKKINIQTYSGTSFLLQPFFETVHTFSVNKFKQWAGCLKGSMEPIV